MRRMTPFLCTTVSILLSMPAAWAAPFTIDDCLKSARNGSEICDDAAFFVPADADLVLVCLDDNGGMGYVSSNTGPVMTDGMARCQGWEEQGMNAWDHLDYVDSLICDAPQKQVALSLPAGSKRWMGSHDYPQVGQGHFTMACLVNKNDLAPTPEPVEEPEEGKIHSLGIVPNDGAGCATTFLAGYSHEDGADAFRIVQLWIGTEVSIEVPSVPIGLEDGIFFAHGQSCLPGEDAILTGQYGDLNCANSSFFDFEDERWVYFDVQFHPEKFAGEKSLFFDAKGGEGDPEPRLGWTEVGTFTVVDDPADVSCVAEIPTHTSPSDPEDAPSESPPTVATTSGDEPAPEPDELSTGAANPSTGNEAPGSGSGSNIPFTPPQASPAAHVPESGGCRVTRTDSAFNGLLLAMLLGWTISRRARRHPTV